MKTLILYTLSILPFLGFGQVRGDLGEQNPNHEKAYEKYQQIADSTDNQLSVTLQNTYEPIDEWQAKKDWRDYKKKERFDARMYRKKYGGYYYYNPYRNRNYHRPYYGYRYNNRRFNWSPYFLIP